MKARTCQNIELPVLLVLVYVRPASLFIIERVGPINADSPPVMLCAFLCFPV
jgi:hypothetical protein